MEQASNTILLKLKPKNHRKFVILRVIVEAISDSGVLILLFTI